MSPRPSPVRVLQNAADRRPIPAYGDRYRLDSDHSIRASKWRKRVLTQATLFE
jgi:hypothetical protein